MKQTKQAICHPDKALWAKGLCRQCYTKPRNYYSKQSRRAYHLRDSYGIDQETFLEILGWQHGKCAVCYTQLRLDGPNNGNRACIDHDHALNKVRGVLCYSCNVAIGFMKDNPAVMVNAANYVMGYDLATINGCSTITS